MIAPRLIHLMDAYRDHRLLCKGMRIEIETCKAKLGKLAADLEMAEDEMAKAQGILLKAIGENWREIAEETENHISSNQDAQPSSH